MIDDDVVSRHVVTRMKKKRVEIVSDQNIAPSVERGARSLRPQRVAKGARRAVAHPRKKIKKDLFFYYILFFIFVFFQNNIIRNY